MYSNIRLFLALLACLCGFSAHSQFIDTTWHTGEGTQYGGVAGSNGGNCGLWVDEDDFYHCALNQTQYDSSMACGACIHAYGPIGDITVKVVDRCPECKPGDIDFSTGAFVKVAKLEDGRVPIRWQFVPCPLTTGNTIKIFYDAGTSPYYFKALFSNLYVALRKVEFLNADGSWTDIHREEYNYFVHMGGIGDDKTKLGPYTFRLTSWTGEQIVAENVEAEADAEFDLGIQFSQPYGLQTTAVDMASSENLPSVYFKVEVLDLQGRVLAILPEWNPSALIGMKPQIVIVRQFTSAGTFVQKWAVR